MNILYRDNQKDLPCGQLYDLFACVGWARGEEKLEQIQNFNVGFIHSTLVISAWDGDLLVGAVRVISDTIFRSVIYDLAVSPNYQNQGIGKKLISLCIQHFPNSEWIV